MKRTRLCGWRIAGEVAKRISQPCVKPLGFDRPKRYYSVFFTVSKAGKKAGLNLYVTTAHMRPQPPYAKSVKPVRFSVIVYNIWTGKGLKPAP